jgi:hypothetical protein
MIRRILGIYSIGALLFGTLGVWGVEGISLKAIIFNHLINLPIFIFLIWSLKR